MEKLLELWIHTMTSQKIYFWIGIDLVWMIYHQLGFIAERQPQIVDQILNQQQISQELQTEHKNELNKIQTKPNKCY